MSNTADCSVFIDITEKGSLRKLSPIITKLPLTEKNPEMQDGFPSTEYEEDGDGNIKVWKCHVPSYYSKPGIIVGSELVFDIKVLRLLHGDGTGVRIKCVNRLEICLKDDLTILRLDFDSAWDIPDTIRNWLDDCGLRWQYGVREPGNDIFEIVGAPLGIIENASGYCSKCEDTVVEDGAQDGDCCPECGELLYIDKFLDIDGSMLDVESDYARRGKI